MNTQWMVLEARHFSDTLKNNPEDDKQQDVHRIRQLLDALGYDEAAQYVYGCNYEDWKKRHSQKASEEQM